MSQTLLPWLVDMFPRADEPYSMRDIYERLRDHHTPSISRSATYRALKGLRRSVATRDDVRARNENQNEKTLQFDAEPARLIAKRVTRNKPPQVRKRARKSLAKK